MATLHFPRGGGGGGGSVSTLKSEVQLDVKLPNLHTFYFRLGGGGRGLVEVWGKVALFGSLLTLSHMANPLTLRHLHRGTAVHLLGSPTLIKAQDPACKE